MRIVLKTISKMKWFYYRVRYKANISIQCGSLVGLRIRCNGDLNRVDIGRGSGCRTNTIFNLSDNGAIIIGSDVIFNDGCRLNARKKITIGKGSLLGQNVMIYDHDHDYRDMKSMSDRFICDEVEIGENVWVGSNAIILRGSKIGNRCVIGAGTVVKGFIPDNMIVYTERALIMKKLV